MYTKESWQKENETDVLFLARIILGCYQDMNFYGNSYHMFRFISLRTFADIGVVVKSKKKNCLSMNIKKQYYLKLVTLLIIRYFKRCKEVLW